MSEVKSVAPELKFHKEDLSLTHRLVVRAVTGKNPAPQDGEADDKTDKKPVDQIKDIRQLSEIINLAQHSSNLSLRDLIPDIFLNGDVGLHQYLNGQNVPGLRYVVGGTWCPVPADDCSLCRVEQENYVRRVIVPAVAGMLLEQLDLMDPQMAESRPDTIHALMDISNQALAIASNSLQERGDNINNHLRSMLTAARLNV